MTNQHRQRIRSSKLERWVGTAGAKALTQLNLKPYSIPGDAGFSLTAIFQPPASREEAGSWQLVSVALTWPVTLTAASLLTSLADLFRAYFKWLREETTRRLVDRLYNPDGTKNKWWQSFSKRRFMNKELRP